MGCASARPGSELRCSRRLTAFLEQAKEKGFVRKELDTEMITGFFGLVMGGMDKMIGTAYEESLANIKTIAEEKAKNQTGADPDPLEGFGYDFEDDRCETQESCPFLAIRRDGQMVELGTILTYRSSKALGGTDSITVEAEVVDGKVILELIEREPEISYIDAVAVLGAGEELPPAPDVPAALREVDGAYHTLTIGESIRLGFLSPVKTGTRTVTIRVTGYYIPTLPEFGTVATP